MDAQNVKRIILLGKTGAGKSSLANTIFGKEVFKIGEALISETKKCQAETASVRGGNITLIDTPGFFDTNISEEELKPEIVRCIAECAPGPHAFLIVLKWERFTEQENDVITKIRQQFSDEAFRFATVIFTHGDQLPEDKKIQDFFHENHLLSDLVTKCGGRCHIIDNKYWKNNTNNTYRSNEFQVKALLKSIDETLQANKGGYYTNAMLQAAEKNIQQEQERIRQSSPNISEEDSRDLAKKSFWEKFMIKAAGTVTGVLLGALCGIGAMVGVVYLILKAVGESSNLRAAAMIATGFKLGTAVGAGTAAAETAAAAAAAETAAAAAAAAETAAAAAAAETAAAAAAAETAAAGSATAGSTAAGGAAGMLPTLTAGAAIAGAVIGGYAGYNIAEGADTPLEAAGAVFHKTIKVVCDAKDFCDQLFQKPHKQ